VEAARRWSGAERNHPHVPRHHPIKPVAHGPRITRSHSPERVRHVDTHGRHGLIVSFDRCGSRDTVGRTREAGAPAVHLAMTELPCPPLRRCARAAVAVTLSLIAASALAQGSAPAPAAPAPAPAPAAAPPGAQAAPAQDIVRTNPAAPVPNPNLAGSAAIPPRRGFLRPEPFYVYPFLGVGLGYTDNLLGQATNEISSMLYAISPRVQAEVRSGAHVHGLRYGGNYGIWADSRVDDFANHELVATTSNQFTARTDLTGTAYYLSQQDPRGITARPTSADPDKWRGLGVQLTGGYGARSAQGRIEVDLGLTDKQYRNDPSVTADLDVRTFDMAGRFFYRTGPRTRLLTELRYTSYDYDTGRYSNDEVRLLGGFTWDFTASTTGTVRAGYVRKDFDSATLSDYGAFTADAALRYLIRSYSVLEVAAARTPSDTAGTGFFTVDTYLATTWTHRWAGYLSTRALLGYLNQDVRGANRTDTTTTLAFGAYFDVRTWMRLGAELQHARRSSDDPSFDYTRNLLLFTVGGTL
jgi:hypothetical protein